MTSPAWKTRLLSNTVSLTLAAVISVMGLQPGCSMFMDDFVSGTDTDTSTIVDAATETESDSGTNITGDTDSGTGSDTGADTTADTGTGTGLGTDTSSETDEDTDSDTNLDTGADTGSDIDSGTASGIDTSSEFPSDSDEATASDSDTGSGADTGSDSGSVALCPDDDSDGHCDSWVESFAADEDMLLAAYDARWERLFGVLEVSADMEAAMPTSGAEDDNDDYAFLNTGEPVDRVEIILEFYWNGVGAVGALASVNPFTRQFYEANIWDGQVSLVHYTVSDGFVTVASESPVNDDSLPAGNYRLIFEKSTQNNDDILTIILEAQDFPGTSLVRLETTYPSIGPGYQGIGIWSDTRIGSYISQIQVNYL